MSAPPPSAATNTAADSTSVTSTRPWPEFLSLHSLSLPVSLSDATARLQRNVTYFRPNYAVIGLLILFLSLIFHPITIILFLATLILWFFLYFSRSIPIVLFGIDVDDRIVLLGLCVVTVVVLVFANVWINLVAAAAVAVAVICLHGVFRVPSYGDDPYGGLLASAVDEESGSYSEF